MNVRLHLSTHKHARRLLHIPAEHLTEIQKIRLANHLDVCQDCRAYAETVQELQPVLARAMHIRWDNQARPVTSSRSIQKRWKKVRMKQQVFRASAILAALTAVVFMVIISPGLLNSLFSRFNVSLGAVQMTATPVPGIGSTRVSPADGMMMVFVPAGEFKMGGFFGEINEMPLHAVSLDAFWIDQTEVTNAMFAKFVANTGYVTEAEKSGSSNIYRSNGSNPGWVLMNGYDWKHPGGESTTISGLENHPVVHLSWNDAAAYCTWAGRRLPTEAEWEKAASWDDPADTKFIYPWGNQILDGTYINLCDRNCALLEHVEPIDDGFAGTSPVGTYPRGASPYGALDMAGNAAEWVSDWYGEEYYQNSPASNPSGPDSGTLRIVRGGAWMANSYYNRATVRVTFEPTHSSYATGVRCARAP